MSVFVCAAAEVTEGETEIFLTAEYLQLQIPSLKETSPHDGKIKRGESIAGDTGVVVLVLGWTQPQDNFP